MNTRRVTFLVAWVFSWISMFEIPTATAALLKGTVQSGGTSSSSPIAQIKVTLFEATEAQPTKLGEATTDANGEFSISSVQESSLSIFFATATVSQGVEYVVILGPKLPVSTTINELTTVAASFSMAQFFRTGVISGKAFRLQLAAGMNDNLVAPLTGESSSVLLASPNADETNSLRTTRSLANLLAACRQFSIVRSIFFALTTPPRGPAPKHTAQALANLARDPGRAAEWIYYLTKLQNRYEPPLADPPDAWTVTVKVNDTGDDDYLFGGPGGMVFDAKGFAWITNNTIQGQTVSSKFMTVLQPNGRPADGTLGTPTSPIVDQSILGQGLGITIDPTGTIWAGNFGWGGDNPTPDGIGSVTKFSAAGAPLSGPNGYQGGPVRVQGTVADRRGTIWLASFGNDSVFVFPKGNPGQAVGFEQYEGSQPFSIALAADGSTWVTNGGGFVGEFPSSVARFALVNGVLERRLLKSVGKALKTVAVDSRGNAWVASQGDSTIYAFRPNGQLIGGFTGGGVDGPWGTAVDGEDNLWVANFGPLAPGSDFTTGGVSKLAGANPATRPPGTQFGDPLSPETGYTVPSAGSEVLLHNGVPLYGTDGPPSYSPIMRQTYVAIDQAGNLWSLNNWKPNFNVAITSNPGGDGIIIFVGLAPPPK